MEKDQVIKKFLFGFAVSSAIFLSINVLQGYLSDYITSSELAKNPPVFLSAHVGGAVKPDSSGGGDSAFVDSETSTSSNVLTQTENCHIAGLSALSIEVNGQGEEKVLFEKSANDKMLIASLSKLMTAIVASEFYLPDYKITISQTAFDQEEETGELKVGEQLRVIDLLYTMLIESSNDAAYALSEPMTEAGLVALMNLKAETLGLNNTSFVNPSGLDEIGECNQASARDLVSLAEYILGKPQILEIISKKELPLYLENGVLHHVMHSTNALLGEAGVWAGKTGKTQRAGGCLLVFSQGSNASSTKISVVLNSADRFSDMRKILTCQSFN